MAAAVAIESRWVSVPASLLVQVGAELQAASKRRSCWLVLALGLVNLFAGLVFATDWLPTFAALDIIYANFACALWVVALYLGAQTPLARYGQGIAAKMFGLAFVVGAMLAAAGTVAVAVQLCRGTAPLDLPLYAAGLYANLGLSTLHLAALAVAMQAIVGRKWLAMGATAIVWIGTNLGFEHPLLRFGAPINPASGMDGFGPFVASGIALGIHWTGCCVVLTDMGRRMAGHRSARAGGPPPRPLAPNVFAVVWTAAVAWVVSGGWILHTTNTEASAETARSASWDSETANGPQPVYSRLDIAIQISPLERILVSRGRAIAVNRQNVPIPELHFGIPRVLEVVALVTTGELSGIDQTTGCHRYRLNRPLEPKETLKIEFDLKWTPNGFADPREPPRLLENGTFVSTADVVPGLGCTTEPHPFAWAPPVAYRARISSSLDQVAVTAGTLVRAWKENGWSFFEYEAQVPISPFTTIHAGHYATRKEAREGSLPEVFYHPKHRDNVDGMIDAGRAAVARPPKSGNSPGLVRVVEVPDYRPFRSLGLLGVRAETRRGRACPGPTNNGRNFWRGRGQAPPLRACERPAYETAGTVLPYSERGYPLNTPPPTGSTPPRA